MDSLSHSIDKVLEVHKKIAQIDKENSKMNLF